MKKTGFYRFFSKKWFFRQVQSQAHKDLTEADIVAELRSDSVANGVEEEEEEEEENAEIVKICSHTEAKRHLHELRKFFEASSRTSDSDFFNINKLELSLLKKLPKGKRPSKITLNELTW